MPLASSFDFSNLNLLEGGTLSPKVDVNETDKHIRVSVELPGMKEKDIDVSLNRDSLMISGEKKQEIEENVQGWYRMERSYGVFRRTIALPCEIDQDKVEAHFKDGVLTVSLPKTAQAQATTRAIPINKG